MTTQALEEIIEGGCETQNIEFKGPCDWNVQSLAKDILAMTNVRDGGYIIVGIEDGTYERKGVTPQQKATYNVDIMKDQMTGFADPHVNFQVETPKDKFANEYVVIRVLPFNEVPVICRKNGSDVKEATIYYRNRNRRVESAAVSNSFDMREIILHSAVTMMRGIKDIGLSVDDSVKKKLDDELGNL